MNDDDDEKIPAPVVWGLLTLALEKLPEGEPEPESNVIYLADYRLLH
jgi:hypothetical protein